MARDARLRQAEDPRQLGDVEALARQEAEQPEAGLVAEQPVDACGMVHIHKSTLIDVISQDTHDRALRGGSYTSSIDFGQLSFSRRESERSARTRPPV